ncbi:hypothetical protein BC830DRAFT_1101226 [Chytriomyces sp. MP71]|nr:hypothetical protein BC830DRAFT_1101226 [Chytriomyces sp. MP71]
MLMRRVWGSLSSVADLDSVATAHITQTERRGKTFLGAGGKILSSIAKAITGSGQPSRSIMRDVAGPTAAPPEVAESKPAQGTLDSISQAIVVSTREAQWNRAKDGKIHSAPVVAAVVPADTAPAARLLGGLDAKLAEKPWVHEIYSEKAGRIGPEGEGLNPVDVAVDDVIREGIQKLKAKL